MTLEEWKTKRELLQELNALRSRAAQLEQAERSKGNQDVMESEQTFRVIFNNAADGILVVDVESKKFYMGNNVMCQILGYDQQEIKNLGVADIHPEEDLPYIIEQFEKQARGEITLAKDIPVKRKDGSVFYADVNSLPITLGSKSCLMGIFRDVTERKNVEQALKESEEPFRMLAERMNEGLSQLDENGRQVYVNKKLAEMLGYTPDEMIGRHWKDFYGQDAQKIIEEQLFLRRKRIAEPYEITNTRKDGQKIYIHVSPQPIFDRDGEFRGSFAIMSDITERKQAGDALRESEEKWRSLAENVPDVILTVEPDGTILFLNHTVPPFTPEKAIGTSVYDYVPPEYRDTLRDAIERVVQTGEPYSYEIAGAGPDGRTSWYHSRLGPNKRGGQVVSLTLIATDVTEHKLAEDALRQSEIKHRTLLENLPQRIFLKDRNSVYVSCNENFADDLNIKPDEIVGKTDYDFFPKELAEKYRADDKRIIESGQTKDIEEKAILQGREMIVHTVKTPVKDEQGNIVGVLGIFQGHNKAQKDGRRTGQVPRTNGSS